MVMANSIQNEFCSITTDPDQGQPVLNETVSSSRCALDTSHFLKYCCIELSLYPLCIIISISSGLTLDHILAILKTNRQPCCCLSTCCKLKAKLLSGKIAQPFSASAQTKTQAHKKTHQRQKGTFLMFPVVDIVNISPRNPFSFSIFHLPFAKCHVPP